MINGDVIKCTELDLQKRYQIKPNSAENIKFFNEAVAAVIGANQIHNRQRIVSTKLFSV